jgi:hypothetical protein
MVPNQSLYRAMPQGIAAREMRTFTRSSGLSHCGLRQVRCKRAAWLFAGIQ